MGSFSLPASFPFVLKQEVSNSVVVIVLTLLIAILADNILRSFIKVPKSLENRQTRTYAIIFRKIITVVVYSIALYFIFHEIGIDLTPLLASAGIIGVVVGIGARALFEDLINGFFLLTQDAVAVGDYVKIDEVEGVVEKLGFKNLNIRGDSGELFVIPNGIVKKVINYSRYKSSLFVDIPVKSDQDIDMTLKSLEEALAEIRKEKDFKDHIIDGTHILGIIDYKLDGRIVIRVKIITSLEARYKTARRYRYLVKKNFEKYKIALI